MMVRTQRFDAYRGLGLFRGVGLESIECYLERFREMDVPAEEVLLRPGESNH